MAQLQGRDAFLDQLRTLSHTDGSPIRALVADDDPHLAELMGIGLRMAGWRVEIASDGPETVRRAKDFHPDILVLDVMMPTFDGVEALQRIRTFQPGVLALFLTAKDSVQNRVDGLAAGGDDYVTKPFSMEEVLPRLYRLISRSGLADLGGSELVVSDLVLNEDTREVHRGGAEITLTTTQFELLRYLMGNARTVVSKVQILDNVWHSTGGDHGNIVELYISYLRKKIDAGRTPLIHTVRGAGYVLKPAK